MVDSDPGGGLIKHREHEAHPVRFEVNYSRHVVGTPGGLLEDGEQAPIKPTRNNKLTTLLKVPHARLRFIPLFIQRYTTTQ